MLKACRGIRQPCSRRGRVRHRNETRGSFVTMGIGLFVAARRAAAINMTVVLAGLTGGVAVPARAEPDPKACHGIDFDAKRPLVAAKVSTRPHVNFIKGSDDDPVCPADKEACRKKTYLVPGDAVLIGRVRGAFAC